ncbi:MAG: DUF4252 domain-containing protein [Bryobacteraceae bacterium]|jgi:hypothetical protein
MKAAGFFIAFLALAAGLLPAQQVKWNFDKLAARASDSTEVSLDGALLQLGAKFLSDDDKDQAKIKKLVGGLKGIYIKTFEFKKPGEYSASDVEPFRAPLHAPEWQRIVGTHSNEDGESVEVYIKNDSKGIGGLVIISTAPKELTLVNIVGAVDLDSLSELGKHFDFPEVEVEKKK